MPSLASLKLVQDLNSFAMLLGMKPAALAYILYKIPHNQKYKSFDIEKRSGGVRKIKAPEPRLKLVQRRLANLLLACQFEIEDSIGVKEECALAHGFKPRLSIVTNAEKHRNRRWVLNTDIEDFFPSINFGRVYGFFQKNRYFALSKPVATIIAQIACHENQLPQGSPCSPVISNIIAHILDIHLNNLAVRHNCTYTRYADDLTFSTNEKRFPRAIAKRQEDDVHKWLLGPDFRKALKSNGFRLNPQKTRMQYCDSRQEVTGLVVNEKVNVRQRYYKQIRVMTRYVVTGKKPFVTVAGKKIEVSRDQLRGMLSFVYFIKSSENNRIGFTPDKEKDKLTNFQVLYKQYLDYVWFYGIDEPTIICEGKTDNIYLRAAIKARGAHFPDLVKTKGTVMEIRPRFFKYSDTAAAVQDLSGGTGELNNLLTHYRNRIRTFKDDASQPVIIVVDNDSGAKTIFSHIYHLNKKAGPVDGSKQFYHIYENLYVVPVPKVAGADTPIEKLFEKKLLSKVWNGKSLDLTGDKDASKYYFKNDFAVHVVKKGGASVKFDGFDPLLQALVAVKLDYAARLAASAKPTSPTSLPTAKTAP
jgi:retron-type reverse transcriptase